MSEAQLVKVPGKEHWPLAPSQALFYSLVPSKVRQPGPALPFLSWECIQWVLFR